MPRALVTGSAGFIGRHIRQELIDRNWTVWGVDIRDGVDCRDVFRDITGAPIYDLIVHCAYHVGGREGIDRNVGNLALNLDLDARLFTWAVESRQRRVLYFSSSAAYPIALQTADRAGYWLAESDIDLADARQPDARYGWAKLTGEHLAASARERGLAVHVVRPFSGYGSGQDDVYPFPAIVSRARTGNMAVWGPAGQTRDWVHVDDVVHGSLAAVTQDVVDPINLCTGVATEFGELAKRVATLAGVKRIEPARYLTDRPTGVMHRVGDPKRMSHVYTPRVSLDEGIRRALEGSQ